MDERPQPAKQEPGVATGFVFLRDFDEGVIRTIGGDVMLRDMPDGTQQTNFFLPPNKITQNLAYPGTGPDNAVLITFVAPEETYEVTEVPTIVVRRKDHVPALQRWHPHALEYRIAAPGAVPVTDQCGNVIGYNKYESKLWAISHDIPYDLATYARTRTDSNLLYQWIQRIYQPPARPVYVLDSLKDRRSYDCFYEGTSVTEDLAKVSERVVGFTLSIRVEGELDLNDPMYDVAVTQRTVTAVVKPTGNRRR